jgi:peroxiredoxin
VPATRALLALFFALALGCREGDGSGPTDPSSARAPAPPAASAAESPAPAPAAATASAPSRKERPLPGFEGTTTEGAPFAASDLLGRRALLLFFNPDAPEAAPAADAVARVAREQGEHNFAVVGVALAADAKRARSFAAQHGLDFAIVEDPAGRIAARMGLRGPVAMVGTDAEGYVVFGVGAPPPGTPEAVDLTEAQLRDALRLPAARPVLEPTLGARPRAPLFSAERLGGGDRFELASLRDRPIVLVFFLYTCPHCHEALAFFKAELAKIPEEKRPHLVGVSVAGSPMAVQERLRSDGFDFFPVVLDADQSVRSAYGVMAGVPDIFVIDSAGAVVARVQGWREDRDPVLMRMWLARASGQPVPMLLHSTGYSGSEVCGVCHEQAHDTWLLTQHAHAFDTLVRHGADANPECVGCHVVGYGKAGGYAISPPTRELEDVGCETCHGRGGPHLSPDFVSAGNYEPGCLTCHDPKHSLGFEYATFLPRVSHAANAELAALPLDEKQALLASRELPRSDLLPSQARYVGAQACQPCHAREHEVWARSPHAAALASLERKGASGDEKCQLCHVTALGRPGGFAKGTKPAAQADLARVGCESCHGPGGDHVGDDAARVGTIVSLGDKCDSCVILQICGSCHDDANDPGFEFEVEQKIDAQRHGTIEPAATRRAGKAAAADPASAIERGFALLDAQGR